MPPSSPPRPAKRVIIVGAGMSAVEYFLNIIFGANLIYSVRGGVYKKAYVQNRIDRSDKVEEEGGKLSVKLHPSGQDDMSILAMQRLNDQYPSQRAIVAGGHDPGLLQVDYEFAEPPRVTSLQNTVPLATFTDFGDDVYFIADQRGYEAVVYHLAGQYLKTDKSGNIVDPGLQLNKVVREISYSGSGVRVKTEDNKVYKADYVMVSTSLGVLQSDLIQFKPQFPVSFFCHASLTCLLLSLAAHTRYSELAFMHAGNVRQTWKVLSIYQFDMAVYQDLRQVPQEAQYPDANVLLVTVTDEESRRIEQQSDNQTKAEIVEVLRSMFPGEDVPDATDVLVPRWWSDRFYRGTFSNWPIGVNRYEYDQLRAPVGRVYFTGEHTSEHYNGYVHGAYLSGIDSADILINCAQKSMCKYHVRHLRVSSIHDSQCSKDSSVHKSYL
ncbi:hypothetical protein ZWY2020_051344 [Hordeum vulgare]|nr:hypothetical protein ZWY2020_051344 [Hordeum vulgare]